MGLLDRLYINSLYYSQRTKGNRGQRTGEKQGEKSHKHGEYQQTVDILKMNQVKIPELKVTIINLKLMRGRTVDLSMKMNQDRSMKMKFVEEYKEKKRVEGN